MVVCMKNNSKILFLSAIDFKDKSIQVIRKTPEAYANDGWEVDYIVARDNSMNGNYFYEEIIDIPGVNVIRFNWPFSSLRSSKNRFLFLLFSKIASILVILMLFYKAFCACMKKDYDYIYGYEMQGVLSSNILKIFFYKKKYIARFQGVYYIKEHLKNNRYLNLLFNLDVLFALWLPSDLLIMTDDGTQGNKILEKIKSKSLKNYLFISNGVEKIDQSLLGGIEGSSDFLKANKSYFILVSRLVKIKRVHLLIEAFHKFINGNNIDFNYYFLVVGDGSELDNLKKMTIDLNIEDYFVFVGAVKNIEVYNLIHNSLAIFSLYESSNIGNPFFESMQCGTPMIAINNGDTSKFIKDGYNGILISEESIVDEIVMILNKISLNNINFYQLGINAKLYSDANILSWEERLKKEIKAVSLL